MKFCSNCKLTKQKSLFHKNSYTKDGLRHRCADCMKIYKREKYVEKYPNSKPRIKLHKNIRDKDLKRKYNISLDDYNEILKSQNSKCKICLIDQKDKKLPFSFDHCHKTGKIIGLLFNNC